ILARGEEIHVVELFLPDTPPAPKPAAPNPATAAPLRTLKEVEREAIATALEQLGGNQSRTAQVLGIDRKTLRNKMKEYGLLPSAESH
ncbi:MAG: hypothetical protein GX774_18595, partial [Armatimonadetes bacterium]|nr:hypothetical protein [Armatimonadota bacterium]